MGTRMEPRQRAAARLPKIMLAALITALVIHFGFTLIYLSPDNPIKQRMGPVVHGYMSPFFEQRWEGLVAAEIDEARHLLVSCRIVDRRGEIVETPWSRTSAAAGQAVARDGRLLVGHLERVQASALSMIFEMGRDSAGPRLLARIASAECDRLHGPGRTLAVRVRAVRVALRTFARRHQRLRAGSDADLGWMPHERVAPRVEESGDAGRT